MYDTGEVKSSNKDNLMPKLKFVVFRDVDDYISLISDIKVNTHFPGSKNHWYTQRWLRVFNVGDQVRSDTYSLY